MSPGAARETSARCAYCHDPLQTLPPACPACKTLLHPDCARQAKVCPTLGCARGKSARSKRQPGGGPRLRLHALGFALVWAGFAGFVLIGGVVATALCGAAMTSLLLP